MLFALRRSGAVAVALLGPTLLAGCGALTSDSDSRSDRSIAAAFYPLAYAAQRVAGDRFEVVNLTQPGQEPHDLELGVSETAAIADADLVVVEHGLQPAVDETVDENAGGEVLDVTDVVDLRPMAQHDGQSAEEGDLDPHFWQDPLLMAKVGDAIADKLGHIDPDHADDYNANAAALRADLEELDQEYADGLADCQRDTVVVNHDAFEYLGRYGLHLEPIIGLSPEAEPTPADLARLERLIRDDGITTVFSEALVSKKTAETLADDLGITTTVLDPIEGLSDDTAGQDYLSLMRRNLIALEEANDCA